MLQRKDRPQAFDNFSLVDRAFAIRIQLRPEPLDRVEIEGALVGICHTLLGAHVFVLAQKTIIVGASIVEQLPGGAIVMACKDLLVRFDRCLRRRTALKSIFSLAIDGALRVLGMKRLKIELSEPFFIVSVLF